MYLVMKNHAGQWQTHLGAILGLSTLVLFEDHLKSKLVIELKQWLKQLKLKQSGKKEELIKRILDHYLQDVTESPEVPTFQLVSACSTSSQKNQDLFRYAKAYKGQEVKVVIDGKEKKGVITSTVDKKTGKEHWGILPEGKSTLQSATGFAGQGAYDTIQLQGDTLRQKLSEEKANSVADFSSFVEKLKVLGIEGVYKKHQANIQRSKPQYRVCRISEREDINNQKPITPRLNEKIEDPIRYFTAMYDHVSRGTAKQPFISATADVHCMLWWSFYGILPVIKIDGDIFPGRIWDFSVASIREDIFPSSKGQQHQRAYAGRSSEILYDQPIPFNAYKIVKFQTKVLNHWKFGETEFPEHLSDLIPLEVLRGCTSPIKVNFGENTFVVKRGLGPMEGIQERTRIYKECEKNTVNEFLSLACYHFLGILVPDASLYQFQVSVDGEQIDATFYLMMTHWIHGKEPNYQSEAGTFQTGIWADVVLQNLDVVGPNCQNLLIEEESKVCYRIDAGGCLGFSAKGSPRNLLPVADILNLMSKPENDKATSSINCLVRFTAKIPLQQPMTALKFKEACDSWKCELSAWKEMIETVIKRLDEIHSIPNFISH